MNRTLTLFHRIQDHKIDFDVIQNHCLCPSSVTVHSSPGGSRAADLASELDRIYRDLEQCEEQIRGRLRAPLENRSPTQDLANRLQELEVNMGKISHQQYYLGYSIMALFSFMFSSTCPHISILMRSLTDLTDFLSRNLIRLSENWSLRGLRCRKRWGLFLPRNRWNPPLPACPPNSAPSTTRLITSTPSLIFITKSKMKFYLVVQCRFKTKAFKVGICAIGCPVD